jgi:nucleotide-binding universal stress UspA family protein
MYKSLLVATDGSETAGEAIRIAMETFIHSCGSIWRLLDDIAEPGSTC